MVQLRLELAQSAIAASGDSSAGQLEKLQAAEDKVCQLQSELAQARGVASDAEAWARGSIPLRLKHKSGRESSLENAPISRVQK